MAFNVLLSEISGTPQGAYWSQVYKEKDQLYFLLNIVSNTEEDTAVLGKQIATEFTQYFFESTEKPFIALKNALEKIKEKITGEIACAVLQDNVLYVASLNNSYVFLHRQNKLINLLPETLGLHSASGYIREEDIVIMASSAFVNQVGLETIKESIDHHTPEDITGGLAPIVLGSLINAASCCLVIKLEKPKIAELPKIFQVSVLPIISSKFSSLIKNKTQKTTVSLALIFLSLLVTSVVLNISRREEEQKKTTFNKIYEETRNKYEEGKAIIDLNNTQARAYLLEAKNDLNSGLVNIKNKKSSEYKKANDLLTLIDNGLTQIGGVYKISTPEVFYDLSLISDKIKGAELSLYKKNLLILDTQNSSLYKLDLSTKAPEVLAGGSDLSLTKYIALSTDPYFFSPKEGVIKIAGSNKTENVIKLDKDWGIIGGIVSFSGNIYMLDRTRGAIVKYILTDNGFSEARMYLSKDTKPDFSKSIDFIIDGYVWVLNSDGTIVKFGQGIPLNFQIIGLDKDFASPTKIFASDETKNIYVLDKGNNRVAVLSKDGAYQAQYEWGGISGVSDLVALEDDKKLLLLSGNKIYSINLK